MILFKPTFKTRISTFISLIYFAGFAQNGINSGEGTYYDGVAGGSFGNCSLNVASGDYMHCAINNADYNNAMPCGAYIRVYGAKGAVDLQVVDRCPECKKGDIDMTREAFAMIDDVVKGRVPITWEFIPNPNPVDIKIRFKEGSSMYWTAIQLFDVKYAVEKLEYLTNGRWKNIDRKMYNFFVAENGIASPMQLRATSVNGSVKRFNTISITPNTIKTSQQFSGKSIPTKTAITVNDIAYPNPASTTLTLKTNTKKAWQLLDARQRVLQKGSTNTIDLSTYEQGIYFLKIKEDKKIHRIVKQ